MKKFFFLAAFFLSFTSTQNLLATNPSEETSLQFDDFIPIDLTDLELSVDGVYTLFQG